MAIVPSWVNGKGQGPFKAQTMGKLLRSPNHSANGPSPLERRGLSPPPLCANPALHLCDEATPTEQGGTLGIIGEKDSKSI